MRAVGWRNDQQRRVAGSSGAIQSQEREGLGFSGSRWIAISVAEHQPDQLRAQVRHQQPVNRRACVAQQHPRGQRQHDMRLMKRPRLLLVIEVVRATRPQPTITFAGVPGYTGQQPASNNCFDVAADLPGGPRPQSDTNRRGRPGARARAGLPVIARSAAVSALLVSYGLPLVISWLGRRVPARCFRRPMHLPAVAGRGTRH